MNLDSIVSKWQIRDSFNNFSTYHIFQGNISANINHY